MGLMNCKLTCGDASVLWPKPQKYELSQEVQTFNPLNPKIEFHGLDDGQSHAWLKEIIDDNLDLLQQEGTTSNPSEDSNLTIELIWYDWDNDATTLTVSLLTLQSKQLKLQYFSEDDERKL